MLAGESPYISDIHYDNSTQKFQVQVNFAVEGHSKNQVIGTLTLGIDIEMLLENSSREP